MAIDVELRSKIDSVSAASISTRLIKRGIRNCVLRGVSPVALSTKVMFGPAYTLRYIPAREDIDGAEYGADPGNLQRQAIDCIPQGHVLVIDCRGMQGVAAIGAVLARRLRFRGAAGVVADGGIRDPEDMLTLGFPAFGLGPAILPNFVAHHAVDIDRPIACGGVPIYPGDYILGDGDGVVVIPPKYLAEVVEESYELTIREEFLKFELDRGRPAQGTYPPDDATLERYRTWQAERPSATID